MSRGSFLLLVFLLFLWGAAVAEEKKEASPDIQWLEKEHTLTYYLPQEGRVKIRAGVNNGPVYRTIVNLEHRPKGQNREQWDGKDETGDIDYLKHGTIHFCVDIPVKPSPDYVLDVKFVGGEYLINTITQLRQTNKLIIDVPQGFKALLAKRGAELRVYIDDRLQAIEKVNALPYTLSLKTDALPEGQHCMVMNLWEALDFSSVAYKSFEVMIPEEGSQAPPASTGGAHSSSITDAKGKIAFCQRDKDGFWQVFTCSLDGHNVMQLTYSPIDKRYPCWSPDGSEIAYTNNKGELWIMGGNESSQRKIPLPVSSSEPKFSSDGKKMLFTSLEDVYHGNAKIWEVDLKTLQCTKLINRPWLQYNPSYSPDGSQVLFTDGPELFEQDIRKLDRKTGDITQVTDNGQYDYDMQAVFLNSGQEIVYATNESGDYEIFKMDKFGRDKVNLSRSPASRDILPQVSYDDQTVYFLSDRSGLLTLWRMNIKSLEAQRVFGDDTEISSFSVYTKPNKAPMT